MAWAIDLVEGKERQEDSLGFRVEGLGLWLVAILLCRVWGLRLRCLNVENLMRKNMDNEMGNASARLHRDCTVQGSGIRIGFEGVIYSSCMRIAKNIFQTFCIRVYRPPDK